MELYVLLREGYDDPIHNKYYLDRTTAINDMIRFVIQHTLVACIYVYKFPEVPTDTCKLHQSIECAHDLRIWETASALGKERVLDDPSLLYDRLAYITF